MNIRNLLIGLVIIGYLMLLATIPGRINDIQQQINTQIAQIS